MAMQTEARPRPRPAGTSTARARPPRVSSVPAFGGWEVDGKAAAPDYSQDFTKIRAARMHRRTKALSWSSFVETQTPGGGGGGGKGGQEEEKRQWSSTATSDVDDDDDRERRHRHGHRRLRSDDIDDSDDDDRRQPIQPGRPAPKGRGKFKGYLFGCVDGQW